MEHFGVNRTPDRMISIVEVALSQIPDRNLGHSAIQAWDEKRWPRQCRGWI